MRASETVGELAAALSKAQAAMRGAEKSAKNPHLRNRYADLASCWDACREPLAAVGLSVVQLPAASGGTVSVTTRLMHSSGEWVESELSLPWAPQKGTSDAQAIGSALTYARRYGLMAIVGLAPVDEDDGAGAGRREPAQHPPTGEGQHESWAADRARFCARLGEIGMAYDDVKGLCAWLGRPKPSAMPQADRARLLEWLGADKGVERMRAYKAQEQA